MAQTLRHPCAYVHMTHTRKNTHLDESTIVLLELAVFEIEPHVFLLELLYLSCGS